MATQQKNAYATLLTRPSYLAGAILLAYTLHKHSPTTPLIVLYTPDTLPQDCVGVLKAEMRHTNVLLRPVQHLKVPPPPNGSTEGGGMVAQRFVDTWTKLRVFEIGVSGADIGGDEKKDKEKDGGEESWDHICFLDADMMVFRNPSPLIFNPANSAYLDGLCSDPNDYPENTTTTTTSSIQQQPLRDQPPLPRLLATHVCVCNLDHDAWAPPTWTPPNCAYTHLRTPDSIPRVPQSPAHPPPSFDATSVPTPSSPTPTPLQIFNSGTFLFRPTPALSEVIHAHFVSLAASGALAKMAFPDQDFLNGVFGGRWASLTWRVNALKTWRYWHGGNVWEDEGKGDGEVAVLHYIVDKPWVRRVEKRRVKREGEGEEEGEEDEELVAGYLGKDGVTHSWWWAEYAKWVDERSSQGESEALRTVEKFVAREGGDREEESEDMKAIGGAAQELAKKWEEGDAERKKKGGLGMGPHGPILRKAGLGERGHGPVVRGGRGA